MNTGWILRLDTCSSCHLPVKKVYSNSFRFGLETFNSFILEPKEHLRLFAGKALKISMDLTKIRRRQERERQKPVGLMSKTRSLQVSRAFLLILCRPSVNYQVK